jgi:hypothetical protein
MPPTSRRGRGSDASGSSSPCWSVDPGERRHCGSAPLRRRRGLDRWHGSGGRRPQPAPERRRRADAGFAAAVAHRGLPLPAKAIWASSGPRASAQTGTLFERWNTYSRVRVTALGENRFRSAGAFRISPQTKIDQDYPRHRRGREIRSSPAERRYQQALLSEGRRHQCRLSGAAAGRCRGCRRRRRPRRSFRALFGAKHIHGIEINPAIFEVLTDKFADFSGHLDRQPGVSLVNAEARSYINHSSDRYDLVQISLIDTWAATAAGGLTLTENRLYTSRRGMISTGR